MKIGSIVLCAGVGSRLKSNKSKILHEICGRTLGYWSVKSAMEVTNAKPVVVVSHQRELIENNLSGYFLDKLSFAHQETPKGTADAVKTAIPFLDPDLTSVLVMCGDTPLFRKETLEKLVRIQKNSHAPIAMLTAICDDPTGYGRIVRNNNREIENIVEDQEANALIKEIKEINPAVYVFDVQFLKEHIARINASNQKQEFYLTDLIDVYVKSGSVLGPISNMAVSLEEMHGVNDRAQLAYAQKIINRRILSHWMLEGVTFIDPESTYVEDTVRLAKDVIIYPSVHLRGETVIDEGAIIENGSVLKDCLVGKHAHILPYTCGDQANIGEHSSVGPFARLRPGTKLLEHVHIGNFVEVKNSRLHSGVKAGHLAYIGDTEVGEKTNIGAGTITCNFDGHKKHRTNIGNNSFIGSNTTLVAPLNIGNQCYVAGGSLVNEDVPDHTLAIGRARQVNKPVSAIKKLNKEIIET